MGPKIGLHVNRNLTICGNLPFNGLLYAEFEVIALYSHEHQGNYAVTKCIGGRFNKIGTLLIMLVHSYKTEAKTGVNCLKEALLSKRTNLNGGGPPRLAK